MTATPDPWLEQPSRPAPTPVVEAEGPLPCPHCGTELTPHHDAVGSLHCYDTACVGCCFLPPDETSLGQPRPKFEARPCPTGMRKAATASAF